MPILSSKILIVTELKVFYNHFTHRICIKKYIYIYITSFAIPNFVIILSNSAPKGQIAGLIVICEISLHKIPLL